MPAALDQSEPQKGSGGSWIGISSFRTQRFRNESGIIPAEKVPAFGSDGSIIGFRSTILSAGGGYGYLWDGPANLFASILGGATLGVNLLHYDLATVAANRTTAQVNAHLRGSFGLNSPRGFLKVTLMIDYYNYKTASIDVGNAVSSGLFAGGLRF